MLRSTPQAFIYAVGQLLKITVIEVAVCLCVEFSTSAVLSDATGFAGGRIHRTSEHHPICRMRLVAIRGRIDCDRNRWVR